MSLSVRPILAGERQIWEKLLVAYADFYQVQLPTGTNEQVWQWIHDPSEQFWCDVAVTDSAPGDDSQSEIPAIIGFTQYQLMHRSLSGQRVCYLSDLYVEPAARGAGAGRALIDGVFEFARNNRISNVRWLTQDYNYQARQLYDSYGKKSDFILYSFDV